MRAKGKVFARRRHRGPEMKAGAVDELTIHVAPRLLGAGVRLFDHAGLAGLALERPDVVDSPQVTHLSPRVTKAS